MLRAAEYPEISINIDFTKFRKFIILPVIKIPNVNNVTKYNIGRINFLREARKKLKKRIIENELRAKLDFIKKLIADIRISIMRYRVFKVSRYNITQTIINPRIDKSVDAKSKIIHIIK
jgi:hypothetical protein